MHLSLQVLIFVSLAQVISGLCITKTYTFNTCPECPNLKNLTDAQESNICLSAGVFPLTTNDIGGFMKDNTWEVCASILGLNPLVKKFDGPKIPSPRTKCVRTTQPVCLESISTRVVTADGMVEPGAGVFKIKKNALICGSFTIYWGGMGSKIGVCFPCKDTGDAGTCAALKSVNGLCTADYAFKCAKSCADTWGMKCEAAMNVSLITGDFYYNGTNQQIIPDQIIISRKTSNFTEPTPFLPSDRPGPGEVMERLEKSFAPCTDGQDHDVSTQLVRDKILVRSRRGAEVKIDYGVNKTQSTSVKCPNIQCDYKMFAGTMNGGVIFGISFTLVGIISAEAIVILYLLKKYYYKIA